MLLSDGNTPHFTTVSHLDPQTGRIFFIDPWPDKFFLLEGRNVVGTSALIVEESPALVAFSKAPVEVKQHLLLLDIPKENPQSMEDLSPWFLPKAKFVGITKVEFEQVIVGLSSHGSMGLLDYFLSLSVNRNNDFRIGRAFGLTALKTGRRFATESARALSEARKLAMTENLPTEELFLAQREYLAWTLTYYLPRTNKVAGGDQISSSLLELSALEKK